MTVEFQIRGMKVDDELRRQVETDLGELRGLMEITAARVVLDCQRDATPAYQAVALLAVSGPDVQAAARDHTWPAAWRKVMARLREQMEERRSRQKPRHESQPGSRAGCEPGKHRA
jgi:ribosome-associated translation inhibitor RaiA